MVNHESPLNLQDFIENSETFQRTFEWVIKHVLQRTEEAQKMQNADFYVSLITLKAIHTWDVIEAMWDILEREQETIDRNPYMILALTHDVERFTQALLGSYSDRKTGFNHAKKGAEFYNDKAPQVFETNLHNSISHAIDQHSNKIVDEPITPYTNLIRDADKLSILRRIEDYCRMEIPSDTNLGRISQEAINDLREHQLVDHAHSHNPIDNFLLYLAWIFDLNSEAVKMIVKEEKIVERILTLIRNNLSEEDLHLYCEIEEAVIDWISHNIIEN